MLDPPLLTRLRAETESAHGRFDFASEKVAAPDDLRYVLDDYESVAYRRRDHERNAMLMKVVGSVPGYAELLESAKEQASTLAAFPPGAAPSGHRPIVTSAVFSLTPQRSTIGKASRHSRTEKRTRR